MYKQFFIIFVLQYAHADDDESNEKYIDLLPEEEKQEFLNNIARRILEGVNNPQVPNDSHAEINEEQLNAQNAYVNKIIKESRNTQIERRDDNLSTELKPNEKVPKTSDNERHIDLTLRAQRREEKNDSEVNLDTTSELKVIPVKNDQENFKPHGNSVTNSEPNKHIKTINDKNITNKFIDVNGPDLITSNDSRNTENLKVIRKSYDDQLLFRTTMSNYDPNSEENTSATEGDIIDSESTLEPENDENANTTETDEGIIWISTQKIFDEKDNNENINSKSSETTSHNILTMITYGKEITTGVITNLTLEPENSKQDVTTLKTLEYSSNSNQLDKNISNKPFYVRSGDDDLKNVSNVTQVTYHNLLDLKPNERNMVPMNKTIKDTISDVNIINSHYTKNNESEVSIYLVNNNKENIIDEKVNNPLRANYDSKESEIDTSLKKNNFIKEKKSNVKEYEVFEIVADKSPFVMKSKVDKLDNKDAPNYVPVYNYEPNYAQYKPQSRFGPNRDDKEDQKYENYKNSNEKVNQLIEKLQTDSPIIRSIFSGYNKKESSYYRNKPGRHTIKKQYDSFDLPRPIKINNFQNIYYNPNDYLDMDYYFGRTNVNQLRKDNNENTNYDKKFPDSNDEDHPYQSIHISDSVKDHIRAVRKILYLQHIYENIPEFNKTELRKYHEKRLQNIDKNDYSDELRKNDENNIAIDYYFGLMPNIEPKESVTFSNSNKNILLRNSEERKRKHIKGNDKLNMNNIDNKLNTKLNNVLESLLEVLRDFIRFDNDRLTKYNWLESTVDIISGINKLLDLTKKLQFGDQIHPKDLELLKYTLYLYKSTVNTLEEGSEQFVNVLKEEIIKRKKGLLPKNKWNNRIRHPLKLWKDVATFIRNGNVTRDRLKLLYDFEDFLQIILFFLHDLHDGIKHIAIITKYNNQMWYEDLKNIFINSASNENLLKILLHLSVNKLLNCIEETSTDGAEDNFKYYITKNKEYVKICKQEFLFVLNMIHELRRLNNKL